MGYGTRLEFSSLIIYDYNEIGASYSAFGDPTTEYIREIVIKNTTDADILISNDGATNKKIMPPNSYETLDITTNTISGLPLFLPVGTQFYFKYRNSAPTQGYISLESIYAEGGQ